MDDVQRNPSVGFLSKLGYEVTGVGIGLRKGLAGFEGCSDFGGFIK